MYFLRTVKLNGITIQKYGLVNSEDTSSYYITFKKQDGTTTTFVKQGDKVYYNNIKLCENVDEFKVIVDKSEKDSISMEIKIKGKTYKSQYVLNS